MKNLDLQELGLKELSKSEQTETNGGWLNIAIGVAAVVLVAVVAYTIHMHFKVKKMMEKYK